MSDLQTVKKTRSDGVEQGYRMKPGEPQSQPADRVAFRETRADLDRRMYSQRLREAAPSISDADVARLYGHVPARYAERGLRNGRTADEVIESYQEHAPSSANGEQLDLTARTVAPATPVRASTPALKRAASIDRLRSINFGRKHDA
jgi:hypothetical protein